MERRTRFLGLLAMVLVLLVTSGLQAHASTAEAVDPKTLRTVKEILKLDPTEIKELYQEVQDGEIGINGIVGGGLWWGGFWTDVLDTAFVRNDVDETPAQEFLRLGTGRCTDDAVQTSITLTIRGSRGSNYQNQINSSFDFSASGSRTWTKTEHYCGPDEPNMLRIFYKQGVYNEYRAVVVRMYFDWDGVFSHLETKENRLVQVPHPSYPTRDIPWSGS